MRCLRSLPPRWASTWWPFSSSILKLPAGNTSTTRPWNSMCSSRPMGGRNLLGRPGAVNTWSMRGREQLREQIAEVPVGEDEPELGGLDLVPQEVEQGGLVEEIDAVGVADGVGT